MPRRPWLLITGIAGLLLLLLYRHGRAPAGHREQTIDVAEQKSLPGPSDFAILCMTTQETSYDWMSFSNKHKYAKKHGHDLIWDFEPAHGYAKVWDKLNVTRDAVEATLSGRKSYQWLWMVDFDTLITNTDIRLDSVIEQSLLFAELEGSSRDDMHLILTRDCQPLNAGSMFLRASPWVLDFVEQWRAGANVLAMNTTNHNHLVRNEQEVLRDMLASNEFDVVNKSVIAPQWIFNAYPEEIPCRDTRFNTAWKPGMFVMHFAGAGWVTKQQDAVGTLMRKYWPMVDHMEV
ncbi:hypothetical protein CLAFUW4_12089 [Fulvia fulva]|uniref:Glycosyltransferase family 34 protein n=1 Tax=Passalora fulva TaxID=5499 RepID=A0A9Q8PDZ1_PASFU|nr:uncharacterized protein CLAFUR5_11128 [Fulvia fulva]KAK4618112.1 hypothetical protein CLAFUR4_12094 [Fulvia fulva]KAK4618940.1 hypothetical protein CLAFUR0_12105 [Fulvia fulva]UJO20700.1 hypothetical protein CLAFUR5_11128 [Fulvia fulva]WPV18297.1 hypothetical protein CLAFUW4_12089 [Fulvia fulva]WPV32871.1 hypothetical protein CLAFUW7_12096 [Fulvia fulva]